MFGDFVIESKADLIAAVEKYGFLPFFQNSIEGFSIEERISPALWFSGVEGPWEWKGPVIREAGCAYGKFFEKKACFISRSWFYHLANYRRDGYDFDARYEDGLASYKDKLLYELIEENAPVLSKHLKSLGNYKKGGNKGFDTSINRLQAQGYVIINNFVYMKDKFGKSYGWGVAEYTTPEELFGEDFSEKVYESSPEESFAKLLGHFTGLFPNEDISKLKKFLG